MDTKSAIGRFFLTIVAAFAEMERGVISERTSMALRHKMAQGEWIGAVPFGFQVIYGRLVAVKEETDVLTLVVTLRDQGYTLQAIADELILRGIPTRRGGLWRRCTVRDLLTRAERELVHD